MSERGIVILLPVIHRSECCGRGVAPAAEPAKRRRAKVIALWRARLAREVAAVCSAEEEK